MMNANHGTLLITCLLFLASAGRGQNFPSDFTGHWQGQLQWYQTGKKKEQKIPMRLIILPGDSAGHYSWQIIYGEGSKDNRPYVLKPADTSKGHWQIDERNGIILDQYWIGGKLSGAFTVQNSTIINTYWLQGKTLIVEFINISPLPLRTTGGSSDDIPPVNSYAIKSYQKAILKRKNKGG